jgi:hypothetical protein
MSTENMQPTRQPGLSFDPESGISADEQKDILQHIEDIVTRNKIATTPADFVVKAAKRGVLFPTVVMVAAVVGIAAGGALFYFLFQQGQTKIVRGTLGTITAEGQLIQAVRQEASARLQEKNQEINTIQGRLADIDKQRQDLQTNMDQKVSLREQELRAQMAAALDSEKTRLEKEGLSKAAIAIRMQDLEKQRNAQLQRQLDAFRNEADTQRLLAEKSLKTLQTNFEANLAKANSEKQQALADAQKREQDLKGQFSQKTASLESAQARAEQALAALAAQREKEDLLIGQLSGLYGVVRTDISEHEYDKALAGLGSIRDFVNRPDVLTLPALAKRHDFDVFVIDSLSSYIQGEIDKAKIDTATLLQAANQFTLLRQRVSEAQDLLKAGKTQDAEKAYGEALNLIPEVAISYAYFVGRDKIAEDARQARLAQSLDNAETAIAGGNYAAAASAYRAALSYIPVASDRLDKAIANLEAAGVAVGSQQAAQAQTRAAVPLLLQSNGSRDQGDYSGALAGYLDLVAKYPLAAQTRDALAGIQVSVRSLSENAGTASKAQQTTLGATIASLQKELAASHGDNADLQQKLKDAQDRFDAMDKSYKDYMSQEDPVLKAKGDAGLMDTKPYFDAFFRAASIQQSFPGISDRVKRYDQGFQSAGRSDAIQDTITIVVNYARQKTPELKRQFIQTELKTYAKDPDMTQLLEEMDQRLAGK